MARVKKDSRLAQAAKVLGKAGGKKGGPARARALTADKRSQIAKKGGEAKAANKDK